MNKIESDRKKRFMVDLIPTLNRAIIMSAFTSGKPLTFAIKYDKKTTALQFQFDTSNPLIETKTVEVEMFRNLDKCKFCNIFFKVETEKNSKKDYRGKFVKTKSVYDRHLIQFLKERYDLHVNDNMSKPSHNYIQITGWKLQDADNDLLFYFVERVCYNNISRMKVVRTAGFQISTKRGIQILDKYFEDSESMIRKVGVGDDIPDFLDDLGDGPVDTSNDDGYDEDDDEVEEEEED
jgi:hypothetical protein